MAYSRFWLCGSCSRPWGREIVGERGVTMRIAMGIAGGLLLVVGLI